MSTDSLIIKIVEYDTDFVPSKIDTTMYILYDNVDRTFIIKGCRNKGKDYSFYCKKHFDVVNFIWFVLETRNKFSYILYNTDELPYYSNDITYDFLHEKLKNRCEISGYDDRDFDIDLINRLLRMVKKVSN